MVRYKTIVTYDGTNFNGFQKQLNRRTVQEEIEKTLRKMVNGKEITVFGSGRTDAGIHAIGQVIHFDHPEECPLERMRFALDTQSSEDITVRQVEIVSEEFHTRYLVKEKTYQFRVDIGKPRSPFRCHYASYSPYPLDLEKIQQTLPDLLGTHGFTSFCTSGNSIEDKVRTIYEVKMGVDETKDGLLFISRGGGSLYKMIRILVEMLLKVGDDRLPEDSIPDAIAKKDRSAAGPTAHPEGLCLYGVKYKQEVVKKRFYIK